MNHIRTRQDSSSALSANSLLTCDAQRQMCYEHRVAFGECCVVQEHYVLCAWLCVVNTVCSAGADAHLLPGCQCTGQQLFTFPVEQI